MPNLFSAVRVGLDTLRANPLRTSLSTLGVVIGVASLVAVLAVGARGLAQRLASGEGGAGMVAVRGLEFAAALAVIAVGALLLTGYLASERMFPA